MESVDTAYFERLYADSDDPWSLASRWYEARKRALTLAVLPEQVMGSVFEPGCAGGDLTCELAPRARRLVAMDLSERAVRQAQTRLAGQPHVEVRLGMLPDDWPDERFDAILLSEMGYYFTPASWSDVVARCVDSLKPGGAILACHWRHDFDTRRQSTAQVHGAIAARPELHPIAEHVERDFIIQLWSLSDISVGQREGLS